MQNPAEQVVSSDCYGPGCGRHSSGAIVRFCLWLDAVQLPGGQEVFSGGKGMGLTTC